MTTTLRAMTVRDLEGCVDLYVTTFAAPPWSETWAPDDVRRRLSDFLATPSAHGVVAADDRHATLGFALGHVERFQGEDQFLLQEMCVAAGHRRAGLGSQLLDALAAAVADVRSWYLLTARESAAAAFYERHGFRAAHTMGVFVRP